MATGHVAPHFVPVASFAAANRMPSIMGLPRLDTCETNRTAASRKSSRSRSALRFSPEKGTPFFRRWIFSASSSLSMTSSPSFALRRVVSACHTFSWTDSPPLEHGLLPLQEPLLPFLHDMSRLSGHSAHLSSGSPFSRAIATSVFRLVFQILCFRSFIDTLHCLTISNAKCPINFRGNPSVLASEGGCLATTISI